MAPTENEPEVDVDLEADAEAPDAEPKPVEIDPDAPLVVKLRKPIKRGSAPPIEELVIRFNSRAMQGFKLQMNEHGVPIFDPHACAALGVRLAGQPDDVLKKLGKTDFMAVASSTMGFLVT